MIFSENFLSVENFLEWKWDLYGTVSVEQMVTTLLMVYLPSPAGIVEPVSYGQDAKDYLSRTVNNTLIKGLTELCKKKPQEPIVSRTLLFHAFLGRITVISPVLLRVHTCEEESN